MALRRCGESARDRGRRASRPKGRRCFDDRAAGRGRTDHAPDETVVVFNTGGALKYLDVHAGSGSLGGPNGKFWADQSPNPIPIARAVRTTSKSTGTRPSHDFLV